MLDFLKKNKIVITIIASLIFVVCLAYAYKKYNDSEMLEYVQKLNEVHAEEMQKIDKAISEERAAHQKNIQQLNNELNTIKNQYAEQQKLLEAKKRQEVINIVKQYKDNPGALADKLSETMGFKVILPR